MKTKTTPETKIRINIKPGLDVFVNTPEEVAKIKAKYSAHTTVVLPVYKTMAEKFFGDERKR